MISMLKRRLSLNLYYETLTLIVISTMVSNASLAMEPTYRDIEYARLNQRSLKLDIFVPQLNDTTELNDALATPLVVWIHGGGWRSGDKDSVPVTHWVQQGFAIASVDYRLSPEASFPAQIHDIKAAIRFLRAHAADYHFNPQQFIVAGSSAGGHLAALVGVTSGVEELEGLVGQSLSTKSEVQAIVSFFGASNLLSILSQSTEHGLKVRVPALQLLLGGQPIERTDLARLASPVTHVDASDPPLWLCHGDADPQMPIEQSQELWIAYQRHSIPVEFEIVQGGKHGGDDFFQSERLERMAKELRLMLNEKTTP